MSNSRERDSTYTVKWNVGSLKEQLATILRDYKCWIAKNPGRASDVESFFKITAYLLPGRIRGNSTVLPELLYSTANVVSFWHDYILKTEQEFISEQARAERLIPRGNRNGTIPGGSASHFESSLTLEDDRAASRKRQIFKIQIALTILEYFEVFLEVASRRLWGDVGRWIVIFSMQAIK